MKETELRLGSIIELPFIGCEVIMVGIPLIEKEVSGGIFPRFSLFIQCQSKSGDIFMEKIEKFKPIPLTEDWLLKFGFEKTMAWTFAIQLKGGLILVYYLGEKGVSIGFKNYAEFDCKHVHQLQNLYFALTGEELELKTL